MTEIPSNPVKIINERYLAPLKLSVNHDNIGDRKAWGSETNWDTPLFKWRFYKTRNETDGDCYFIVNEQYQLPLKLGMHLDDDDRQAWGGGIPNFVESYVVNHNPMERKYYWKLIPIANSQPQTYKIVNCAFNGYLKLSLNKDGDGDRVVWGTCSSTPGYDDNNLYHWRIE